LLAFLIVLMILIVLVIGVVLVVAVVLVVGLLKLLVGILRGWFGSATGRCGTAGDGSCKDRGTQLADEWFPLVGRGKCLVTKRARFVFGAHMTVASGTGVQVAHALECKR